MRPPRIRIRTMMIAVAAVALALYGRHLWRLSGEYHRLAERYAAPIRWAEDSNAELEARQRLSPAEWQVFSDRMYQARVRWQTGMERKYRRAARFPFLPVAPDQPPP